MWMEIAASAAGLIFLVRLVVVVLARPLRHSRHR